MLGGCLTLALCFNSCRPGAGHGVHGNHAGVIGTVAHNQSLPLSLLEGGEELIWPAVDALEVATTAIAARGR